MQITVFTNDNHLWLLQGFAYLLNRFWGKTQKVRVVGFNKPNFNLPSNFEFFSMGEKNAPVQQWSTVLMEYLFNMDDELILLMLEDYWLYRPVNIHLVRKLWENYHRFSNENNILRIDLTNDRFVRKQKRDYDNPRGFDLISTPPHTPYQMSYQAAIWRADLLFDVLEPNEDPWTSEVKGTERLKQREDLLVLGTKNRPLVYQPVFRTHRQSLQLDRMPKPLVEELQEEGYLP